MGVQHGGGLVHNKAVGPHGDNARNRDALLLAAGQLVRRSLALFIDARQLHGLVDAGADLLGRHAEVLRRKGYVLLDDGRHDLVVGVLEHHADLLAHIVEMVFVAGVHASTSTVPASGSRMALKCFASVDLPQPFAPSTATNSPRRMSTLTPSTA